MGCLTAPFRLIGCLGLLAVLIFGWFYRDRIFEEGHRMVGRIGSPELSRAPAAAPSGRPAARSLASALTKIDSLNGWRADSVVLTASEVASLMGQRLSPAFRQQLDSMEVELLDGEVRVHARLRTARLPREVLGPLASVLGPSEPVEATGPLRVTGPGTGEWAVRSLRIRDFPVPGPAVKQLIGRTLKLPGRDAVPWKVPSGIREVRVRPGGAILYGAPRP